MLFLKILKLIWIHPSNKDVKLQTIFKSLVWQIQKRFYIKSKILNIFNKLKFICYADSVSASSLIYFNSFPDYNEMKFISRYLKKDEHFIDVGSNVGIYTLLAASIVGHNGLVYSFEPDYLSNKRLLENIKLNKLKNVKVFKYAISNKNSKLLFTHGHDTMNRITYNTDPSKKKFQIQSKKLDNIVKTRCSLGKIDIEGAELLALKGATNLIKNANPPVWIIELNGLIKNYGSSELDFKSWLNSNEYSFAIYDANQNTLNFSIDKPWLIAQNLLIINDKYRDKVINKINAKVK